MKIFAKTKDMDREEWLHYRSAGIGGSDAAVIAGVSPWKSVLELWREKTGQIPPEERENEYTHFGAVLENVVRDEFMRRTGLKVRRRNAIFQSEEHYAMNQRFMAAIRRSPNAQVHSSHLRSFYHAREP